MRLIPIIAALLGAIIGVVTFYVYPSVLVADNIWQAIIMGGASGLTATGANQVFKQLQKNKEDNNNGRGSK
jgi:integral membrane sensor domain MASE1